MAKKKTTAKNQRNIREKNLIPYKKGQSGNPKGKPKGTLNFSTKLRKVAEKAATAKEKSEVDEALKRLKLDKLDLAAYSLFQQALKGNVQALKEIGDRLDGRVIQQIETSGNLTIMTVDAFD